MYPTRLCTKEIGSCLEAPRVLGQREIKHSSAAGERVQLVPVVFTPVRVPCSFNIIIPKGFVGLVNTNGRYTGQWGSGHHFAVPWITISHLIPEQYIIYDTPVKECPTQDNVMVTIDVTLVLKINTEEEKSCYNFAYTLGPRGLDEMLKAFQEESIRGMARKRKYNQIYDLMDTEQDKQLDAQRRELNDHFQQYGVIITSISVTNVHLPSEFALTMQEATVWQNRNEFKTLEQKFKLRKIEVKEAEMKEKQRLKEELEKWTADQDKIVADWRKKKALVDAQTSKQLAEIREQQRADVLEIKSESDLTVAELNSERDIALSKITSTGHAEADMIKIETETYLKSKKADAKAKVAKNEAICLDLEAKAEQYAAKALVERRAYEEQMRKLQTLRALASNDNVALTGNSNDNVLAQLLANQAGGAVLGLNANLN